MKEIQLDWQGYFRKFCAAHGGNPVTFKGRLLFRDGWQYHMNHEGPEYPPPEEFRLLKSYKSAYWHTLRVLIRKELHEVGGQLTMLTTIQHRYSLPLQAVVTYRDEDGEQRQVRGDLETASLIKEFDFLRERLLECNRHIENFARERTVYGQ